MRLYLQSVRGQRIGSCPRRVRMGGLQTYTLSDRANLFNWLPMPTSLKLHFGHSSLTHSKLRLRGHTSRGVGECKRRLGWRGTQDSTQALLKDFELQFVPTRKTRGTVFGTYLEDVLPRKCIFHRSIDRRLSRYQRNGSLSRDRVGQPPCCSVL
jgi:hypothetical protein